MKIFSSKYAVPCLIALAGLLAYSNTFHVPFQFDDEAYIVNNPAIRSFHYVFAPGDVGALPGQSPTSVPDALRVAFTTRIVGYASFAANYALHGLDVAGYNNTGRSILVAGFLMHFAQNATMIMLGGIFDSFTMPPAYWAVVLVETAIAAVLVVFFYGSRTLTNRVSLQGLRSKRTASY